MARYDINFDQLDWRGKLGLSVAMIAGLAVIVALIVVSLSLSLLLIPVAAVAYLVVRWRLKKLARARSRAAGQTIAVDYRVVGRDGDKPRP